MINTLQSATSSALSLAPASGEQNIPLFNLKQLTITQPPETAQEREQVKKIIEAARGVVELRTQKLAQSTTLKNDNQSGKI